MRLSFYGAAETVTGSRFLVEHEETRVLVDCGLFQGVKNQRSRNREELPFDVQSVGAIVLTHAHLDHSGFVPRLAKLGFRGPVYVTAGTRDLLGVLWPDSGRLQEEDAEAANRHRYTRHAPAEALYTEADARAALSLLRVVERQEDVSIGALRARRSNAGHIIGASSVHLASDDGSILFSGNLGRDDDPIMSPPADPPDADWLVVESTYGGRLHRVGDAPEALANAVRSTVERGGVVVIPAFAVGRAQMLLHLLATLRAEGRIPRVPVYLDSPMACDATDIFRAHPEDHRLSRAECERTCRLPTIVRSAPESRALVEQPGPYVVISASGMATGGRVLHHLARRLPDARNAVILAGFQAAGTRGESIANGEPSVKIHGEYVPVLARVVKLDGLSAHADSARLVAWAARMKTPPRQAFVVHGEPAQADALRRTLRDRLGWNASVPRYGDQVELRAVPIERTRHR